MYCVAQIGARRHYAVPRALEAAGLLTAFYTDICSSDSFVQAVERMAPQRLLGKRWQRVAGRDVQGVPTNKVWCLWRKTLGSSLRALTRRSQDADANARYVRQNEAFGQAVVRAGFRGAMGVYGFNGAAVEMFEAAKQQGLRTVLDQTMAPLLSVERLLGAERSRWPDWDLEAAPSVMSVTALANRERREWELADTILCGSQYVVDTLTENGVPLHKCHVARWGYSGSVPDRDREPPQDRPLRILVAGTVELRKGLPYILEAARRVSPKIGRIRIVGPIRIGEAARQALSEHVDLAGAVPRSQMETEYQNADLLLHPSLAEGSANVCYEAQAHGLPVITTSNAGSAIRDGLDGFLIPIRDSCAIVERIEQLAGDANCWSEMSRSARQQSRSLTGLQYQEALAQLLCRRVIL